MDIELVLRWLHVIGACVLLGTGAGIAFFMLMAERTGKPAVVAHVASTVVVDAGSDAPRRGSRTRKNPAAMSSPGIAASTNGARHVPNASAIAPTEK